MPDLPIEGIFKRFGIPGLVVASAILGASWYVRHRIELSQKPGSIVITVKGASERLALRLDNRTTDAPESMTFFRVESIPPGQHLIELLTSKAAVFSKQAAVQGGRDNLVDVDLLQYRTAPSIFSLPKDEQDGWMYLGNVQDGRAIDAVVDGPIVGLSAGTEVQSDAPAFIRSSAPANNPRSGYGEAFGTVPANTVLSITELSTSEDGQVWARVMPSRDTDAL